jgi:hypothetical protein
MKGVRTRVSVRYLRLIFRVIAPFSSLILRWKDPVRFRFYRVTSELATRAYRSGNWLQTRSLALESLDLAERFPTDWSYGNAIHNSHQLLGLLALKDKDIPSAVSHLIEAGNSPGSPQLDSFGPRMVLAAELVRRGQIGPVLRYLDSIGKFYAVDKSPGKQAVLSERRKLLPWWLRWMIVPGLTKQQNADYYREKRSFLRYWKTEVKAGRVPNDKRWMREL